MAGAIPGASGETTGVAEKDVTLALAKAIRDELAASGRVRVALTREDDRFIPLPDRYAIARRLDADLFISLHADAAPSNDAARGATVYTLSEVASDREAALLAQRENAADAMGGAALSSDANVNLILIDLAQRESMDSFRPLRPIAPPRGRPAFPLPADWHRFAAFVVLKAPTVPSVLLEAGYITNEEDARFLSSQQGRGEIATGLRRAIEAHFARRFLGEGA
jgi:N-acetylmuramoyl-L-alanine amidase